jgi:hypothetical protein
MRESVCLGEIGPLSVVAALEGLLRDAGHDGDAGGGVRLN